MLVQFGVMPTPWVWCLLAVAAVATALGSRWFKRAYGVVTPSSDSFPGWMGAGGGLGLAVVVVGLEVLRRRPGYRWTSAWSRSAPGWRGARASQGVRTHLYFLAAICVGLAFLPLIANLTVHRSLKNSERASIFSSAFGVGWVYVCIQDYRVIRKNLRNARG